MATFTRMPEEVILAIAKAVREIEHSEDSATKSLVALRQTSRKFCRIVSAVLYSHVSFKGERISQCEGSIEHKHLLPFAFQVLKQADVGPMVRSLTFQVHDPDRYFDNVYQDYSNNNIDDVTRRRWPKEHCIGCPLTQALRGMGVHPSVRLAWCIIITSGVDPEPVLVLMLPLMPLLRHLNIYLSENARYLNFIFMLFELAALGQASPHAVVPFQHLKDLSLNIDADQATSLWAVRYIFSIPSLRRLALTGFKEADRPKYHFWVAAEEDRLPNFLGCIEDLTLHCVLDAKTVRYLIRNMKKLTALSLLLVEPLRKCEIPGDGQAHVQPALLQNRLRFFDDTSANLSKMLEQHKDTLERLTLAYYPIWIQTWLSPDVVNLREFTALKELLVDPPFIFDHPLFNYKEPSPNAALLNYPDFHLASRLPKSLEEFGITHTQDDDQQTSNDYALVAGYLKRNLRAIEEFVKEKGKRFKFPHLKRLVLPKYQNSLAAEWHQKAVRKLAQERGLEIASEEVAEVIVLHRRSGFPISPPRCVIPDPGP